MAVLYRVKPVSDDFIAMETLHAEVKKHVDKQIPKEKVFNILQEYREEIDATMADLIRVDAATAGEYLDTAMTTRYQQRLADLAGALLAASSTLSFKANRGDFRVLPMGLTHLMRKRISSYKGSVPSYEETKEYIRQIRLYSLSLKHIPTYTNFEFFVKPDEATQMITEVRDMFGTFTSPFGKVDATGDVPEFEITWSGRPSLHEGFAKSGWTADKLTECQTAFIGAMIDLSKTMYDTAQAINRFNMGADKARMFGYFSVFAERLTEGLIRLPSMFSENYVKPWLAFKEEVVK